MKKNLDVDLLRSEILQAAEVQFELSKLCHETVNLETALLAEGFT